MDRTTGPQSRRPVTAGLSTAWSLERLLVLDVLLAIAVIGVSAAIAIVAFPAITFKTRVVEVLLSLLPQRIAVVEHFAITGTWLETDLAAADAEGARRDEAPEHEAALAGKARAVFRRAAEGERRGHALEVRAGVKDGAIVTLGTVQGMDQPFQLTFRPAVPEGEVPWSVLWLCGASETPPGWVSPTEAVPSNLPPHLLPSICRGGQKR